jgi:peptidoglycan/LPS O-acetylase OafA/YrhL
MRSSGSSGARLAAGDPLRALAALAVVLSHVVALALLEGARGGTGLRTDAGGQPVAPGLPGWTADLSQGLAAAVWVFFALSGLLLGRPFARALRERRPLPSLRRYARNRVLRIVPAFWAVVALTLLVHGPGPQDDALDVLAVPAFLQTWRPSELGSAHLAQAWSLDVEMAFYVALPLLALPASLARARPLGLLAALAAAALGSLAFRAAAAGDPAMLQSLPALLSAFVPGLALAVAEPWLARRPAAAARAVGAVAAAVALPALAAAALLDGRVAKQGLLLAVGGGGLVAAAVLPELAGRPWRVLAARPLHWLGERSYSLFLVHLLVLEGLLALAEGAPPRAVLLVLLVAGVPASVLAAWALHAAVERPFLRRRASQAPPRPAVAVAA